MGVPNEKLAESLVKLKKLQDRKVVGIQSDQLSRVHRERLLEHGFIREVIHGWYIMSSPEEKTGDTTSWYISFWEFCGTYLKDRYGNNYCLTEEQSLSLHAGNTAVPSQLLVRAVKGNNLPTELLFGTSLFVLKSSLPPKSAIEIKNGIRVVSLARAIVGCSPSYFERHPIDARAGLAAIQDASELLPILLEGGHSTIAGRLVGAYRNMGKNGIADQILNSMKSAGYDVREKDPFLKESAVELNPHERSPYVNRIKLLWNEMREKVIEHFPAEQGLPEDKQKYIQQMEELFTTDAYHSLSIEKYTVTPDLIERVRSGQWNAESDEADLKQKDAMAARGYWQAFNAVKTSIGQILDGKNGGSVVSKEHSMWFTELFAPSVVAGILKPSDLAGYRNAQVYIGNSMHTPMNKEAVRDTMPALFELLEGESHAGVRAVLGHFFFVYIHPYMDGNGRMGRFLMNTMLASGGYPWTVIPVQERKRYMEALESASVGQDIEPFAAFLGWLVQAALDGEPVARI